MMMWQEMKRREQHEECIRILKDIEQPFSFHERDRLALEKKKKQARDPNRFRKIFKAKEVPSHVREVANQSLQRDSSATGGLIQPVRCRIDICF